MITKGKISIDFELITKGKISIDFELITKNYRNDEIFTISIF